MYKVLILINHKNSQSSRRENKHTPQNSTNNELRKKPG